MKVVTLEVPNHSKILRVPRVGLILAGIAITPLVAFAVLWASILAMLGFMWALELVGFF